MNNINRDYIFNLREYFNLEKNVIHKMGKFMVAIVL